MAAPSSPWTFSAVSDFFLIHSLKQRSGEHLHFFRCFEDWFYRLYGFSNWFQVILITAEGSDKIRGLCNNFIILFFKICSSLLFTDHLEKKMMYLTERIWWCYFFMVRKTLILLWTYLKVPSRYSRDRIVDCLSIQSLNAYKSFPQ